MKKILLSCSIVVLLCLSLTACNRESSMEKTVNEGSNTSNNATIHAIPMPYVEDDTEEGTKTDEDTTYIIDENEREDSNFLPLQN